MPPGLLSGDPVWFQEIMRVSQKRMKHANSLLNQFFYRTSCNLSISGRDRSVPARQVVLCTALAETMYGPAFFYIYGKKVVRRTVEAVAFSLAGVMVPVGETVFFPAFREAVVELAAFFGGGRGQTSLTRGMSFLVLAMEGGGLLFFIAFVERRAFWGEVAVPALLVLLTTVLSIR